MLGLGVSEGECESYQHRK
jgi:hypothetical protein